MNNYLTEELASASHTQLLFSPSFCARPMTSAMGKAFGDHAAQRRRPRRLSDQPYVPQRTD